MTLLTATEPQRTKPRRPRRVHILFLPNMKYLCGATPKKGTLHRRQPNGTVICAECRSIYYRRFGAI